MRLSEDVKQTCNNNNNIILCVIYVIYRFVYKYVINNGERCGDRRFAAAEAWNNIANVCIGSARHYRNAERYLDSS